MARNINIVEWSISPVCTDVSQESGITQDDLVSTLQYYSLVKYWKGKHIVLKNKVREGRRDRGGGEGDSGERVLLCQLEHVSTRMLWSSLGRRCF